ncbi:hypothetical protein QWZ06_12115 [Chryseobacterium tructae]|uniref:Bacteriocin n=1 Tax=Chryseobacterium tructae TaxID=1037380 RepID=A0ABV7XY44_9FLAO|nr:hypothetical protein [Chryseobacterium tructae]MDN3692973.1 hypothetical protein [Chryseobacterium tructae]
MKAKKQLKFSKETILFLDNTAKKSINGGNDRLNARSTPYCITGEASCWVQCINKEG